MLYFRRFIILMLYFCRDHYRILSAVFQYLEIKWLYLETLYFKKCINAEILRKLLKSISSWLISNQLPTNLMTTHSMKRYSFVFHVFSLNLSLSTVTVRARRSDRPSSFSCKINVYTTAVYRMRKAPMESRSRSIGHSSKAPTPEPTAEPTPEKEPASRLCANFQLVIQSKLRNFARYSTL